MHGEFRAIERAVAHIGDPVSEHYHSRSFHLAVDHGVVVSEHIKIDRRYRTGAPSAVAQM